MYQQQFTPMTVGQILDRTFTLYKKNFLRYVTITAIVYIPIALIAMVVMAAFVTPFTEWAESAQEAQETGEMVEFDVAMFGQAMVAIWAMVFFLQLGETLSKAALAKGVSESYLGGEATVGDAVASLLRRSVFVVVGFIVVSILFWVGFFFCVVPGVIFGLWFMLTTQVIVVEKRGPFAAMGRSRRLISGNMGKALGLACVLWLITAVVGGVFGQVGQLAAKMALPENATQQLVVSQLSQAVGQTLALPIAAIAMILFYYDLRIRKEGFDLQMLAQTFGMGGMPADGVPPVQY